MIRTNTMSRRRRRRQHHRSSSSKKKNKASSSGTSSSTTSSSSPPLNPYKIPTTITTITTKIPNNSTPYHKLPLDCRQIIFRYHLFHIDDAMGKYNEIWILKEKDWYPGHQVIHMHSNDKKQQSDWNFIREYALSCDFSGTDALKLVSWCRCMTRKPSFYYLQVPPTDSPHWCASVANRPSAEQLIGELNYLRGVTALELPRFRIAPSGIDCSSYMSGLFRNIRGGIKKLRLSQPGWKICESDLRNLRGIRDFTIMNCDMTSLPPDAFHNLRGIQSLNLESCKLNLSTTVLENFRGIKRISCSSCDDILFSVEDCRNLRGIETLAVEMSNICLTDEHMTQLRGSIRKLYLMNNHHISHSGESENPPFLSNDSFENVRGIEVLCLQGGAQYGQISDEAFVNLRGVKKLFLHSFPRITSRIFKHLSGIQRLHLESCASIEFFSKTLQHLRGVKYLHWTGAEDCEKLLDEENMKRLCGVKELELENVVTTCDQAFRHLSQVRTLTLLGRKGDETSTPLSAAAFSHLDNVERIKLSNIPLDHVHDFVDMFLNSMPKLKSFELHECSHSDEYVGQDGDGDAQTDDDDDDSSDYYNDCVPISLSRNFYKDHQGEWKIDTYEYGSRSSGNKSPLALFV